MLGRNLIRLARQSKFQTSVRSFSLKGSAPSRPAPRKPAAPPGSGGGRSGMAVIPVALGLVAVGGGIYLYSKAGEAPPEDTTPLLADIKIEDSPQYNMSVEEYDRWRREQSKKFGDSPLANIGGAVSSDNVVVPPTQLNDEGLPKTVEPAEEAVPATAVVPDEDVTPAEMKSSLQALLQDTRKQEADFMRMLKDRGGQSLEDKEKLQMFRDEKARIKKQLRFLKQNQ